MKQLGYLAFLATCALLHSTCLHAQVGTWTRESGAADWPARFGHASAVFNSELWVLGGRDTGNLNDVWSSDDGRHWVKANTPGWGFRSGHSAFVLNGEMWVLAGRSAGGVLNDAWRTSSGQSWTQSGGLQVSAAREQHATVVFNGSVWVLGGLGASALNDVWSSSDGSSYSVATASAGWPARYGHTCVAFNNKLWVIGGQDGTTFYNDVWSSSNGVSWTQETVSAAWTPRSGHSSVVFNNEVWVINGDTGTGPLAGDVWHSADGINWVQAASTPWLWRARQSAEVYLGRLWMMGGTSERLPAAPEHEVWSSSNGGQWDREACEIWPEFRQASNVAFNGKLWTFGGQDPPSTYFGDVWSSANGRDWSLETSSAAFGQRTGHLTVVFNNKIWLLGGFGPSIAAVEIWSSVDGVSWTLEASSPPWSGRSGYRVCVFNSKLWLCGGSSGSTYYNDVWSSPDGITWTQETAAAAWPGRGRHTFCAYDGELWVLAGYDGNLSVLRNDVWHSTDGVNWTSATSAAPWSGRQLAGSAVVSGRLWIVSGSSPASTDPPDVWSTDDGTGWVQEVSSYRWYARTPFVEVMNDRLWVWGAKGNGVSDVWSYVEAPQLTAPGTLQAQVGLSFSYTASASGLPLPTYSATGLPSWLSLNTSTGELSGTPAAADAGLGGTITLTATNAHGADNQPFQVAVGMAPQLTSTPVLTVMAGMPYSYIAAASGFPAPTFSVTGQPGWLALNTTTGELSGIPAASDAGLSGTITVSATNAYGADNQQFQVQVVVAPQFTSTPVLSASEGTPYSYAATASGYPAATLAVSSILPAWLTFSAGTGLLSGTPTSADAPGNVNVVLTATNGYNPDATQSFTIVVAPAPSGGGSSGGGEEGGGGCAVSDVHGTLSLHVLLLLLCLLSGCAARAAGGPDERVQPCAHTEESPVGTGQQTVSSVG
ncbi:MAG: putative Ig domain-containing protein [Planctomycetes bacterium]|nr:putative Ig domain-containing protein [Planctomycetota bacterium]